MCFGDEVPLHPTHLGFVDPNCYVEDTIRGEENQSTKPVKIFSSSSFALEAFSNAEFLCEGYYLTAPSLEIRSINGIR